MRKQGMTRMPAKRACKSTAAAPTDKLELVLRRTKLATRMGAAGKAGRMYPGSLEWENEKKTMGRANQSNRNTSRLSSPSKILRPSDYQPRTVSAIAATVNMVQGSKPIRATGRKYQKGWG